MTAGQVLPRQAETALCGKGWTFSKIDESSAHDDDSSNQDDADADKLETKALHSTKSKTLISQFYTTRNGPQCSWKVKLVNKASTRESYIANESISAAAMSWQYPSYPRLDQSE